MNGLRVSAFKVATKALTASAVPLLMPLALGFPAAWHVQTPPSWTQTRCTAPGCPRCCCCCCCRHSGWAQHRPLCIPQWHPGWAAAPVVFAASGKRAIGPPIRTRKRSVVEGKRGICERKKGEGRREKGGGCSATFETVRAAARVANSSAFALSSVMSVGAGSLLHTTSRTQGARGSQRFMTL